MTGYAMFAAAWQYIVEHPDRFGAALWRHVSLSAAALVIAAAISIPLGIWLARRARYALFAINAANVGRTLPSLAVLALMMPLLGTGFTPALFALTLLALPPILINTYAAVRQVDADVIDAARGMGMTQREITRRIVVVLPQPDGPISTHTSPSPMVSDSPSTAGSADPGKRLRTSSMTIMRCASPRT